MDWIAGYLTFYFKSMVGLGLLWWVGSELYEAHKARRLRVRAWFGIAYVDESEDPDEFRRALAFGWVLCLAIVALYLWSVFR